MVLDNADPTFGGEPRLRRQWPEVYGYETDYSTCHAMARVQLGADELAGPDELRAYLGWPSREKGRDEAREKGRDEARDKAREKGREKGRDEGHGKAGDTASENSEKAEVQTERSR